MKAAWDNLPADKAEALQTAANRVRAYAEKQKWNLGNIWKQTAPCWAKK